MKMVWQKQSISIFPKRRVHTNKGEFTMKKEEREVAEDTTKYGEFVSSYFAWIPPEKQKEKAKNMEEMTKRS